jgi:tRNA 2-thiocytidine biosynthesis protein TtcA
MKIFESELAIKVRKQIVQALNDYAMIKPNDHIMVCVSGGKDSSILMVLLNEIRKKSVMDFTIQAVLLDQKQPNFNVNVYREWIESFGVRFTLIEKDTYSVVREKIENGVYCSLCSRLRRGILYNHAFHQGYTKMALGHHRDDLQETLLLNIFYTGKISAMPPKLLSDDKRNVIIRPLVYVSEEDLENLMHEWQIPVIPCNLCGSQEGMKRKRIKNLLNDLQKEIPDIRNSMLTAMGNIHFSQLMDKELWHFDTLENERAVLKTFFK